MHILQATLKYQKGLSHCDSVPFQGIGTSAMNALVDLPFCGQA
jgi:hypothetical protein